MPHIRELGSGEYVIAEYNDSFTHIMLVKVCGQQGETLRCEVRVESTTTTTVERFGLSQEQIWQALGCFRGLVQDAVDF